MERDGADGGDLVADVPVGVGSEVVPVLRQELAAKREPEVAEAPTHAGRVKAKYGDAAPRQPRPNANRGDNVTGQSPYQDSDALLAGQA